MHAILYYMSLKLSGVLKFIDILSEYRWMSVDAIARELEVGRRTVLRYANEIEEAFAPYPFLERGHEGYRLCRHDFVEHLQRMDDFVGLSAAMSGPLSSLLPMPTAGSEKIQAIVGENLERQKALAPKRARLLIEAMREGRILAVTYDSGHGSEERRITPIKMFFDYGICYLVCHDQAHGHLILLALDKMRDEHKTNELLEPAALRELRAYTNSAWGKMIRHDSKQTTDVVFDVSPAVAPYFTTSPLHASQKSVTLENGMRITICVHNETEIVRFLLRFGEAVKIIEPKSTIELTLQFLKTMQDHYAQ